MNRLVAFLIVAFVCLRNPVHDTDLFWQVSFGRLMLATGGPVVAEPFYPDAEGRPIVPIYGLTQLADAVCLRVGGWPMLKIVDAVVWALAFTLPAIAASRRFGRPSTAAMLVGFFAASAFYMTRPQSYAMLGFGALIAVLLSEWKTTTKVMTGAAILVLWQNFHPSAIVGGLLLAGPVAMGWLVRFRADGPSPWAETLLLAVVPVAMLATPAGTGVFDLMSINTDRVELFGVNEWLPIYHPSNRGVNLRSVVGLLLFAGALVWSFAGHVSNVPGQDGTFQTCPAQTLTWAFVAIGFAAMTIVSHRFVVFFGIVVIPFGTRLRRPQAEVRLPWPATSIVLALALIAARWGIATERLPIFNAWFPLAAVDRLVDENLEGPVFTTTEWGGLISYRGFPTLRPLMDGRYFARTRPECEQYWADVHGRTSIDAIVARHRPVAFLLTPDYPALIPMLERHPDWRLLHADDHATVFVRRR